MGSRGDLQAKIDQNTQAKLREIDVNMGGKSDVPWLRMIADAEKGNPESSLCFSFARLGLSMFQFLYLHQQTKTRFFATCCNW